jgi:hypothetical protein
MWPFISNQSPEGPRIDLIRYLFVWRVNGSLVWLPKCLPVEISLILGEIIANRLPTREARPWRKALAPWSEYKGKKKPKTIPQVSWPIEAVLFAYPGKQTYGQGELLLWELKLLGESADHGLFLETILPAIEEAGGTTDPRWHQQNSLWGQFDVYAVYAARGKRWESIVQDGKLDLCHHPTPDRWAEGLTFDAPSEHLRERLTWLTPFDLGQLPARAARRKKIPNDQVPTLKTILEALMVRMSLFLPGKYNTVNDVWNSLEAEQRAALQAAMGQTARVPVQRYDIEPAPKNWPGRWIGTQHFPFIPPSIIPYLELASILHIGKQTHFGCGTFLIG